MDCYDVLHWLGGLLKPKSYLEVGVREGASLCCVLAEEHAIVELVKNTIVEGKVQLSSDIIRRIGEAFTPRDIGGIYLFDNWSYEGGNGGHERIEELLRSGFHINKWNFEQNINYEIIDGDSKETLPKFLEEHKEKIDLMFVDGDHTAEGAIEDLENIAGHFKVLVFHDIYHPEHGYLADVWRTYTRKHDYPSFAVGRDMLGVGVAFNLY